MWQLLAPPARPRQWQARLPREAARLAGAAQRACHARALRVGQAAAAHLGLGPVLVGLHPRTLDGRSFQHGPPGAG